MNEEQQRLIEKRVSRIKVIYAADSITDWTTDRTLLLGRNGTDEQLHVWLAGGLLHRAAFVNGQIHDHIHGTHLKVDDMVPTGLVSPEVTDFEFALMLAELGAKLRFRKAIDRYAERQMEHFAPYCWVTAPSEQD